MIRNKTSDGQISQITPFPRYRELDGNESFTRKRKKVGILSLLGGDLCLVCPNNLENSSSELLNKVGVSTFQFGGKREREREREKHKIKKFGW